MGLASHETDSVHYRSWAPVVAASVLTLDRPGAPFDLSTPSLGPYEVVP